MTAFIPLLSLEHCAPALSLCMSEQMSYVTDHYLLIPRSLFAWFSSLAYIVIVKHFGQCSLSNAAELKWWGFLPLKMKGNRFLFCLSKERGDKCLFWGSQQLFNLSEVTFQATSYIRYESSRKWEIRISQWYSSQHVKAEMFKTWRHFRCFLLSFCCTPYSPGATFLGRSCPAVRGKRL